MSELMDNPLVPAAAGGLVALLGGLAVLTALRATRDRELARLWWWVGAGFLAGAAIYGGVVFLRASGPDPIRSIR